MESNSVFISVLTTDVLDNYFSMQVAKKLVDSFESGGRLPSCQLRIKRKGKGRLEDLEYMVRLKGAKKPRDFFLIALECDSTPKGMHIGSEKCCMHSGDSVI